MGIFDKIRDVASSAVGGTVHSVKENSKLLGIRSELTTLNDDLKASFEMIGRRFVDFLVEGPAEAVQAIPDIGVGDVLRHIEPKMEKKKFLEAELARVEKELADSQLLQDKQEQEREFLREKDKLDKARAMGVLSEQEYDVLVLRSRRRVDNFEEIRRLEKQRMLGIINDAEFQRRLAELV